MKKLKTILEKRNKAKKSYRYMTFYVDISKLVTTYLLVPHITNIVQKNVLLILNKLCYIFKKKVWPSRHSLCANFLLL